jgi:hypothetical protein
VSTSEQIHGGELRVLDGQGCLTPEVLCFVDELTAEQRAVVQRHVRSCLVCAQQQASLARVEQRARRAPPRVVVPGDARLLVRQALLHGVAVRRKRLASAHLRVNPLRKRVRLSPRTGLRLMLVGALLAGALVALLLL